MSIIEKDDGGAAFPVVWPDDKGVQFYGLSMRDYFAAKAMQALVENREGKQLYEKSIAQIAYRIADAMLEAREQ